VQEIHWTANGKAALDIYCRLVFAADPCEFSALYMLTYIAQAGGAMKLADIKGGAQESLVEGGTDSIPRALANWLSSQTLCSLHLSSAVVSITDGVDGTVVVCADGRTLTGRVAVIAIPPAARVLLDTNLRPPKRLMFFLFVSLVQLVPRIKISPDLPASMDQFFQVLSYKFDSIQDLVLTGVFLGGVAVSSRVSLKTVVRRWD
jgi:hypothetical protein